MKITPQNLSMLQAMARTQEVIEAQEEYESRIEMILEGETACDWTHSEYEDCWSTDCGNLFASYEGTPSENGFLYCPYCGRKLLEMRPETEENE